MTLSLYSSRSANQRRLPVGGDAEPEAVGIDLLAHYFFSSSSSPSATPRRRRRSPRCVGARRSVVVGLVGRRPRRSSSSASALGLLDHLVGGLARGRLVLDRLVDLPRPARRCGSSPRARRPRRGCGRPGPGGTPGARRPRRPTAWRRAGGLAGLDLGGHLGRHGAHDDRDVAHPLADAGGPAPGPGAPALERRALVGVAGRHVEGVGVELVVVLGVGDGRGQAPWRRPRWRPAR